MEAETYKLELQLRIDWSDLDMYKHVNNISFMRYMQSGRVNFWEASGIYEMYENSNMGTMLVSTHCDFKKSLYYPGKAIVKTNRRSRTGVKLPPRQSGGCFLLSYFTRQQQIQSDYD